MALPSRTRVAGILTSGGDCPGLNAAIRGVVKPAISDFHIEVIGIEKGFRGLVENHSRVLHLQDVSNILNAGGTILGTSREKPHRIPLAHGKTADLTNRAVETYHRLGLDCLVVLGGNGTHKVAYSLMKRGLNVIGLPKTIDNDLVETDITFGHDSAVTTAAHRMNPPRISLSSNPPQIERIVRRISAANWILPMCNIAEQIKSSNRLGYA